MSTGTRAGGGFSAATAQKGLGPEMGGRCHSSDSRSGRSRFPEDYKASDMDRLCFKSQITPRISNLFACCSCITQGWVWADAGLADLGIPPLRPNSYCGLVRALEGVASCLPLGEPVVPLPPFTSNERSRAPQVPGWEPLGSGMCRNESWPFVVRPPGEDALWVHVIPAPRPRCGRWEAGEGPRLTPAPPVPLQAGPLPLRVRRGVLGGERPGGGRGRGGGVAVLEGQ